MLEKCEEDTIDHGVTVLNRNSAIYFCPPRESTMIRIDGDDDFPPLIYRDRYKIIQEMIFGDFASIEEYDRCPELDNGKPITDSQAKAIATLIMSIKQEELLVVHCFAGMSRSAAVGVAFARWRRDSVLESMLHTGRYFPNTLVLSSILKHFPGYYPEEEEDVDH